MTDTVALKGEVEAALAALAPQIRGLTDLSKVSLSPEVVSVVRVALSNHVQRKSRLDAVLGSLLSLDGALMDLAADGYPASLKMTVDPDIEQELQEQSRDFDAALGEFSLAAQARKLNILLGKAEPKPKEK